MIVWKGFSPWTFQFFYKELNMCFDQVLTKKGYNFQRIKRRSEITYWFYWEIILNYSFYFNNKVGFFHLPSSLPISPLLKLNDLLSAADRLRLYLPLPSPMKSVCRSRWLVSHQIWIERLAWTIPVEFTWLA